MKKLSILLLLCLGCSETSAPAPKPKIHNFPGSYSEFMFKYENAHEKAFAFRNSMQDRWVSWQVRIKTIKPSLFAGRNEYYYTCVDMNGKYKDRILLIVSPQRISVNNNDVIFFTGQIGAVTDHGVVIRDAKIYRISRPKLRVPRMS